MMNPDHPDHVMALFKAFFSTEEDYVDLLRRMRGSDEMLRIAIQVMTADSRIDPNEVLSRVYKKPEPTTEAQGN